MAYTHTTRAQLRTELGLRLEDSTDQFWQIPESNLYLNEALRTFGVLSGFWRERGVFPTVSGTAFYDLPTQLASLLGSTITDRDIIQQIQFMLLESTSSQTSWTGTEMFTYNDIANAIQNRLNQFRSDTGILVTRSVISVISPPSGRQPLSQDIIDVRRVAWLGASPLNYYAPLWRSDERLLTAFDTAWSVSGGIPGAYSVMAPPPLELQLAPPPSVNGQLELLTVNSSTLSPASTATTLGIPDDLTPAITWGALADLLGNDGLARDPVRAQFAEQRYAQYVEFARNLPVVIHAEINGVPLIPVTLQSLESSTPNWENVQAKPTDVALAAPNLLALNPVPDGVYSVTLDVVRRCPIPLNDGAAIQVGREQLDMILDYAEHLALFKVGGDEWHATERASNNFLAQCLTYNQRISAAARASMAAVLQSQRQKQALPRRSERSTTGVGALQVNGGR